MLKIQVELCAFDQVKNRGWTVII